ncbi:MAG: hypothetical protein DLM57_17115 [Pseudonocardiales bacterium]|nr:MAG: hypothetical protein DLM57_17115 [Pseudonocardiales bacterium]
MARHHRTARTRSRFAGAAVVTALAAGGLLASLGAGYSVSRAALGDGSADVAKGTTVAHVNGESGKVDAQTPGNLATGKQGLQVVRLSTGQFIVINRSTGAVTTVDGATMKPTSTVIPKAAPVVPTGGDKAADVRVIASDKSGWLVNATAGYVELIGDHGPTGKQVQLGAVVIDSAPGPDGSVIVLTRDGVVIRVGTDLSRHRMPITDGAGGTLTTAGGHTFLITTAGEVLRVDGDQPRTLAKPAGLDGSVIAGSVLGSGDHVLAIAHDVLLLIGAGSGATQSIVLHAGTASLGRPVELNGRVYVPDYTNHRLLVANEDRGQLDDPIKVWGTTATFALFVSGGRVWANDQFSKLMVAIDADGHDHSVDKGTGKGIEDPDGKPKTPTPKAKTKLPKVPKVPKSPGLPRTVPPPHTTIPHPAIPAIPALPLPQPSPTNPTTTAPKQVAVPSFGSHTDYHDACAQIDALQLRCIPVAVDATGQSGNTNDVVDTKPGGGSQVDVGSQVVVTYIGQLAVPDRLTGLNPDDACAAISAAQLKCKTQPTSVPASTPQEFGIVNAVNPASGSKVNSGATVTVSYPDTFTMPDLKNQQGAAACQSLSAYQLKLNGATTTPKCTAAVGNTAATAAQAGQVYQQSPSPGAPAPASAAVGLFVYNGSVAVKDWTGADAATALTECQATPGLSCVAATGDYPGTAPANAGKVEKQTPTPGNYQVVAAVTITQWAGANPVPDVTGQSTAGGAGSQACQTLASYGFPCALNPVLGKNANSAISQAPAGAQPLGTTVTVNYSPWQAQQLIAYQSTDGNPVWVMRFAGAPVPAGYGANPRAVGWGYAPGTGVPGGRIINGFYCTAGAAKCDGYPDNHFYSQVGSYSGTYWQGPDPVAELPQGNCAGQGMQQLWRTWNFSGGTHTYNLDSAASGGTGNEFLGCVWP